MKPERALVGLVILGVIGGFIVLILGNSIMNKAETCDWCKFPYWSKGVQVWEFWLDEKCFDELQFKSHQIWGNEWSRYRMEWIRMQIGER